MSSAVLTPSPPAGLFAAGRAGACIGAIALVSLLAFESMAVATAMPAVAAALGGLDLYALAFGGMLAASMPGMVWAGRWTDRRGPRAATLAGLLLFSAGLVLAGSAERMAWFVGARFAMGLGGGMLGVALYAGMGALMPAALHPRMFAMFSAAWVVPGLVGPVLAAWLVQTFGWRSVFLLAAGLAPVAALFLLPAFGRLAAPPSPSPSPSRDESGAALAWAGIAVLATLLLNGVDQSGHGIALLGAGLALAGFAAHGLLPAGALRARRGLPTVIGLRGLLAAAFGTAEVFIPLYLTREMGWSLTQAGSTLSAGAVLWSVGSLTQSRIATPARRRLGLRLGLLAVAAGIGGVALTLWAGWPAWTTVSAWAVSGYGIGLALPMLSVLNLELSAPGERGRNASALQLSDALCTSAALALAGGLFVLAGPRASLGCLSVLAFAATLALVGVGLAGRTSELDR